MSKYHLDAYGAIEGVHAEMRSFLRSSFRFADARLDDAVHGAIDRFGLIAPPVAEATFPYEEPTEGPATVEELGREGVFHEELWNLLDNARGDARWPRKRKLYQHQVDAFRAFAKGKSIVVSSGTGSGKTESFLFPAIDSLLRDPNLGQGGVRVLIVYPLNALVNNQMERLRAILGDHPTIRFGLYTSRLPNKRAEAERKANRLGRKLWPAEVQSREELRSKPPHILVTNYSMLEYALVRTADAPIFAESFVHPRLVVLDEAHVYSGAMAAEITLLMRRAWLRWGMEAAPQGIVTSATMQQNVADGPKKLHAFATSLLSKPAHDVELVVGRRMTPVELGVQVGAELPSLADLNAIDIDVPTLVEVSTEGGSKTELSRTPEARIAALDAVRALRKDFAPSADDLPAAALLHEGLEPLSWARSLRRTLHARPRRVDELAQELFTNESGPSAQQATLKLLELLSLSRSSASDVPLLPVRMHAMARGPHGLYACINPVCVKPTVPGRLGQLFADATEKCECGGYVAELRVCESCGQSFLIAAESVNDLAVAALQPTNKGTADLFVPSGHWDDGTPQAKGSALVVFPDGRLNGAGAGAIHLRKYSGGKLDGPSRRLVGVDCPHCETHAQSDRPVIRRVESGTDAMLQVAMDGLYPHLPHLKEAAADASGNGRRALLFADNRQIAASLAAKIEESHDVILARRLILDALASAEKKSATSAEATALGAQIAVAIANQDHAEVARLSELIRSSQQRGPAPRPLQTIVQELTGHPHFDQLAERGRGASRDLAFFALARELVRRPSRLGNLEAHGLVSVEYPLVIPRPKDPEIDATFAGDSWSTLVKVLLDTVRSSGAVALPDLPDALREMLPTWTVNKWLFEQAGKEDEDEDEDEDERRARKLVAFRPRPAAGNRRSAYVRRVLDVLKAPASVQPANLLAEVWSTLWTLSGAAQGALHRELGGKERLQVSFEGLMLRRTDGAPLYRCPRCHAHWTRQVAMVCPSRACSGLLELVHGPDERDRLVSAARNTQPLGLKTREHTAQIGVDELETFEQAFKSGRVNVLVCSTTMELGIDIGGLSATLLTNVPPGPANYLQRAGRAGRRAEGTSLVLTYARPRPFDQAAFAQPDRPFVETITPPVVKLDSRRIVQRHANAVLLSMFFARAQAFAHEANPMAALGTVGPFFLTPIVQQLAGSRSILERLRDELSLNEGEHTLSDAFLRWLELIAPADTDVQEAVERIVGGTTLEAEELEAVLGEARRKCAEISEGVRQQLNELESIQTEVTDDEGALQAIALARNELIREKLLAYLAERQFLPRYGFPVQVMRLHETWRSRPRDAQPIALEDNPFMTLRLERDVTLALSEYGPGAEVVAGKYVYASRGLQRHWTGADVGEVLPMHVLGVCTDCGRLQEGRNVGDIAMTCPTCAGESVRAIPAVYPKNGFAVKWGVRPRRWIGGARPPRQPVTEAAYAAIDDSAAAVSDALSLSYDEQGKIVVRSEGDLAESDLQHGSSTSSAFRAGLGYAICYRCGRAEPEVQARADKMPPPPEVLREHDRLRGSKPCTGSHRFWRHVSLIGSVQTETLRLVFAPLDSGVGAAGRKLATTLMVALQLSAGEVLGVDSREIGGLLSPRQSPTGPTLDVVLYDVRPGGSGLCRALLERWDELLEALRRRLACPNGTCTTACPKCLLAYETQRHADWLDRTGLRAHLEHRWEELLKPVTRDGMPVTRVHRGGVELAEAIAGAEGERVTVLVRELAPDALSDNGWLRRLLARASGTLRVLIESVPGMDDPSLTVLRERLRIAVTAAELELLQLKPGTLTGPGWRMLIGKGKAYHGDFGDGAGLGPDWLTGVELHRTRLTSDAATVATKIEAMCKQAKLVDAGMLTAPPPSPKLKLVLIPKGSSGNYAKFEHWMKGADGKSLFDRPLKSLKVVDPYLGSMWQTDLLKELVALARQKGKPAITVITYPPKADKGNLSSQAQIERIAKILGVSSWQPQPVPQKNVDKIHKRELVGEREDGTRFRVFLERGLDFIGQNGWGTHAIRITRDSYMMIEDPFEGR